MSSHEPSIERLDLRFLATDSRRTDRGLWVACVLLAVAAAVGGWFVGRQLLANEWSEQIVHSKNSFQALAALDRLIQLNPEEKAALVRGLENGDRAVMRETYQALDGQITLWQIEDSEQAIRRMRSLAQSLSSLPDSSSEEARLLAGGLAARIYSYCYTKDDPELESLMGVCRQVVSLAGASSRVTETAARIRLSTVVDEAGSTTSVGTPAANPALAWTLTDTTRSEATQQKNNAQGGVSNAINPQVPSAENQPADSLDATRLPNMQAVSNTGDSLSPGPNSRLRGSQRIMFTASPDTDGSSQSGNQPSFDEGSSHQALAESHGARTESASESSPSVVRSIGDHGPYQLSLYSPFKSDALDARSDLEIVRLLSSIQADIRKAAVYQLRVRGWPEDDIELAIQLANCSQAERLELVQAVASSKEDPREWLLWMAEDGQPEVRKMAVSLLQSMLDADVKQRLQTQLARERDEEVRQAIHRVLESPLANSNSGFLR